MEDALHDALVALVAERSERQGAVVRAVVADRRREALHDRHLQADGAAHGDDLRERLGRDDTGPRHREPLEVVRRPSAEGGERERDHEHDREDDEQREPAGSTRRARLPTFDAPPPNGA